MIVLEIAAGLFVLILAAAYVCYRLAFSVPKPSEKAMFSLPDTEQYRPYAETARRMIRAALEIPHEPVNAMSYDGHCPLFPTYALIHLGGILFGGFDLESASAAEAMERCDLPVLFIHGEDDRFVPCGMGRENFAHCRSAEKRFLTVPNAGHGMSYMADKTAYLRAVSAFLDDVFRRKKGETGEKTQ